MCYYSELLIRFPLGVTAFLSKNVKASLSLIITEVEMGGNLMITDFMCIVLCAPQILW